MMKTLTSELAMKLKTLALSLLLGLAATSAFAEDQYIVRVPANVNLSAATPETPAEPLSVVLSAEALPAGTVGTPYEFNLLDRLSIAGGTGSYNYSDTTWSLKVGDALPAGLAIEGDKIVGTPTVKNEAGTSFEVTGTYQDASGKQAYTIVVGGQVLQVTQIAVGEYHTCAVTTSGAAKCWGSDSQGQLGNDSSLADQPTPVGVSGLESGVASITAGTLHACAVTTSGAAKCWGYDYYGQLGNGSSTASQPTPVAVIGLESGVASLTAGGFHTCAVTTSGAAKCWGQYTYGQLGNDTATGHQPTPAAVSGLESGVTSMAAGTHNTCAVTTSGAAKCWGKDNKGQLGNDTALIDQLTPVDVLP